MKKKIQGTQSRPRLYIFKSNKHIYAQIIDDINHKILISCSTVSNDIKQSIKSSATCEAAQLIGTNIAIKSKKSGISQLVFDRGSNKYHGRIKALADAARQEGINF
uniref:Large ribosomal subunit protein uL18c n=1 Tax=Schimmelmannia schousboei TaxID=173468 RepID=A0A1C9C911_9FLOR|nr:ribosomal protein L18 [Schimmelmannia schousboei]AOM64868.1 ribosomal protein L18 [Schimmelmannia schousboei]